MRCNAIQYSERDFSELKNIPHMQDRKVVEIYLCNLVVNIDGGRALDRELFK